MKSGNPKFLAIADKEGAHVIGEQKENYGKWHNVDNFKEKYKKEGESLCLGQI